MTARDNQAGSQIFNTGGWPTYLPVAWLVVVLALSLRGLVLSLPVLSEQDLPAGIKGFIYGSMTANAVTVAWGLFVLALAIMKSPSFSRAFAAWQIAVLALLALREIYVLATPAFVFSLWSHLWPAVEAAIGVGCLIIVQWTSGKAATVDAVPSSRPLSVVVLILLALLGVVVGSALGFGVGLFLGAVLAEATDVSCFEGGCGYFAAAIGLIGLLIGAIAGGILAVWLARRSKGVPV